VIDSATKENLCAQDPKSADLLKPFLEGKDLKRWRAEPRGLWLIYIPKNRINIDDYPAIREWLLPFKVALEARATKQEWFELQQAQEAYVPYFEGPKVIYPHFSQGRKFLCDADGYYANNKCFFVPTHDMGLLSLLNSKLQWLILQGLCRAMRGGEWRLELESQYVEKLPIPAWNDSARAELAAASEQASKAAQERLILQTALMRRIPDLCPPDRAPKLTTRLQEWWTLPDFAAFRAEVKKVFKADIPLAERSAWEDWITRDRAEIARLSAEITKAEAQIDSIVYGLFDLTPDEITLLESVV
jgi:hypothetical protein